jgi:hypothetical protein
MDNMAAFGDCMGVFDRPHTSTAIANLDDPKQNWGVEEDDTSPQPVVDYEEDGNRPISFDVIKSPRPPLPRRPQGVRLA